MASGWDEISLDRMPGMQCGSGFEFLSLRGFRRCRSASCWPVGADGRIGADGRTVLRDNDTLHARCGSDAYKLEHFNGITLRRNGANAHGGNRRIVKGGRADRALGEL